MGVELKDHANKFLWSKFSSLNGSFLGGELMQFFFVTNTVLNCNLDSKIASFLKVFNAVILTLEILHA